MAETKDEYGFLDNLTVEETSLPARQGGRQAKVQSNPFTDWLSSSYTDGKGRMVKVPNEQVTKVTYLLNRAAKDLGIGCRIVLEVDGKTVSKTDLEKVSNKKHVAVKFQGKERKQYTPRERKSSATPEEKQEALKQAIADLPQNR